jgi:predicted DNA-binding ribbon-helix-helix protein
VIEKVAPMISAILKRTITIDGHKTSVTLEDEFWMGLREIARRKNATLRSLITQIDDARERNNLSSAIRVFVLNHFRTHPVDIRNVTEVHFADEQRSAH